MPDAISNFLDFIVSPQLQQFFLPLKIIGGSIGIFFVIGTFILISKTGWLQIAYLMDYEEYFKSIPFGVPKLSKQWDEIKKLMEQGGNEEYKLAILNTDSILETVLAKIGFAGADTAERLEKMSPSSIANLEDLKAARRVRDNIVHDPDYSIAREKAEQVMDAYEKAFRSLDLF